MSNPRNIRFYDELDYHASTYMCDNSITYTQVPAYGSNHSPQIGMAVTLTGSGQVGLGANGNILQGKLKSVEADLNGAVQDDGYMQFSYPANDATAPVVGTPVVVHGDGSVVKAGAGVIGNECVSVDTVNLLCIVQKF